MRSLAYFLLFVVAAIRQSLVVTEAATMAVGGNRSSTSVLVPGEPPRRWEVSRDFLLAPEIYDIMSVRYDGVQENNFRIKIMMRRYRKGAVFGLLENKLLNTELMGKINIPTAGVYYGAFVRKSLGNWPQFRREHFLQEMSKLKTVSRDHHFVLKSTTDGGSKNVMVMSDTKWKAGNWTIDRVADFAEGFLKRNVSGFGQQSEHVGVMVQRNILSPTFDASGAIGFNALYQQQPPYGSFTIEIKLHVAFGELGAARVQAFPCDGDEFIDISFCEDDGALPMVWQHSHLPDESMIPLYNEKIRPLIRRHEAELREMARVISKAYAADWVRVDVFISSKPKSPLRPLILNEVTYPSHTSYNVDSCTADMLINGYKSQEYSVVESRYALTPLLNEIGVRWDDFRSTSDYHQLWHASESTYDNNLWDLQWGSEGVKWLPPSPPTDPQVTAVPMNINVDVLTQFSIGQPLLPIAMLAMAGLLAFYRILRARRHAPQNMRYTKRSQSEEDP